MIAFSAFAEENGPLCSSTYHLSHCYSFSRPDEAQSQELGVLSHMEQRQQSTGPLSGRVPSKCLGSSLQAPCRVTELEDGPRAPQEPRGNAAGSGQRVQQVRRPSSRLSIRGVPTEATGEGDNLVGDH